MRHSSILQGPGGGPASRIVRLNPTGTSIPFSMINKRNRSTSVAVRTKELRSLGCAAMQCFVARNKRMAASSRKRPTCTAHNCWCYCLPSSGQRTHLPTPHLPFPQLSLPSHPPCTLVRCRNMSYFLFLWWKVSGASKTLLAGDRPVGTSWNHCHLRG